MYRLTNAYNTGLAALALAARRTSAYAKRSYRIYSVQVTWLDGKFKASIHWLLAPLGQAARWGSHKADTATIKPETGKPETGKTERGLMIAGRRMTILLLSLIVAVGLTALVSVLGQLMLEGKLGNRLLVLGAFITSEIVIASWFASSPSVGQIVGRFRATIAAELIAFAMVGVVLSLGYLGELL